MAQPKAEGDLEISVSDAPTTDDSKIIAVTTSGTDVTEHSTEIPHETVVSNARNAERKAIHSHSGGSLCSGSAEELPVSALPPAAFVKKSGQTKPTSTAVNKLNTDFKISKELVEHYILKLDKRAKAAAQKSMAATGIGTAPVITAQCVPKLDVLHSRSFFRKI